MQKYLYAIFVFLMAVAVLVTAVPASKNSNNGNNGKAKAVKTASSTPKVTCTICRGPGDECKDSKTASKNTTCDKCCKFTGVADDPNEVPSFIWPMMGPNAKSDSKP